jgi:hypothetical protein
VKFPGLRTVTGFKASEQATLEWQASRRRAFRVPVVFVPFFLLAGIFIKHEVTAVTILGIGLSITLVIIVQNAVIMTRADARVRKEYKDWQQQTSGVGEVAKDGS